MSIQKAIQIEEIKDEELMLLRQQVSDAALENSSLALRLKSHNEQSKMEIITCSTFNFIFDSTIIEAFCCCFSVEKMDERYQVAVNSSKELQERNREVKIS